MSDDGFEIVYAELIAERGGDAALSVVDKAICRQAAALLVSDDPGGAQRVPDLLALLPPRAPKPEVNDLSRLNERQLSVLLKLLDIMQGRAPSRRPDRKRNWSVRTDVALQLVDYLDLLDEADKAGDVVRIKELLGLAENRWVTLLRGWPRDLLYETHLERLAERERAGAEFVARFHPERLSWAYPNYKPPVEGEILPPLPAPREIEAPPARVILFDARVRP